MWLGLRLYLLAMNFLLQILLWPCFVSDPEPHKRNDSRMCQSHSRRAWVPVWCWGCSCLHTAPHHAVWALEQRDKERTKGPTDLHPDHNIPQLYKLIGQQKILMRQSSWFPLLQILVLIAVASLGAFAFSHIFFFFWARWTTSKRWTTDPTACWKSWGRGWGLV